MKIQLSRYVFPIAIIFVILISFLLGYFIIERKSEAKNKPTITGKETQNTPYSTVTIKDSNTPIIVDTQLYVKPDGGYEADGKSVDQAFKSIQKAIDFAGPGTTINLLSGV